MKIIFIENRYKTLLYEHIAIELIKDGHEVHWLIQNSEFSPKQKGSKNHVIPYPKKQSIEKKDILIEEIISIDRQQNHFNKKDKSYFYYYYQKIEEILTQIKPSIVFGEATAFHELLAINYCKNNNILFLNPSSCRYPVSRFSFYLEDTLIPYRGSDEVLREDEAERVVNSIVNRSAVPDYMKKNLVKKATILYDKYIKVKSYIRGERFNTPHPKIKYLKEKERVAKIKIWDSTSFKEVEEEDKRFKVFYPLQMQPESSIDVYGKKYINQSKLIKEIVKNLPENCILYLKPNPKSNHELTNELLDLVENDIKIIHLHHSSKMDDVLPKVDLVITVTGTVAIECILSNKPILTLIETINQECRNCIFIPSLDELPKIIDKILESTFPEIDLEEKIKFINKLNSTSFKGIISDPFSDPNCVSKKNIEDVSKAFIAILNNSF